MEELTCTLCGKSLHPFDKIEFEQLRTLSVHLECHREYDRRMRDGSCMRCGGLLDDGRPVNRSVGRHVECTQLWPSTGRATPNTTE